MGHGLHAHDFGSRWQRWLKSGKQHNPKVHHGSGVETAQTALTTANPRSSRRQNAKGSVVVRALGFGPENYALPPSLTIITKIIEGQLTQEYIKLLKELKDEIKTDMNGLKADINAVKADTNAVKADMNAGRAKLNDIKAENRDHRKATKSIEAEIGNLKREVAVLKRLAIQTLGNSAISRARGSSYRRRSSN
ncbi:MAG: hypothetical protein Q9207_004942 [Kuettlingeria erythrocarpa]